MKVEIEENTAMLAFAALIAVNAGEEVDEETEAALRDLGAVIAPEIEMGPLIEALKIGPK